MGIPISRLIGFAAATLALARLGRLLEPSIAGPPWQVTLAVALLLAAGVTVVTSRRRVSRIVAISAHVLVLAFLVIRVLAGDQLIGGVFPGSAAMAEIGSQLGIAAELIRFGAAPVLPVPGLVAVLMVVFWVIGWLLAGRRPLLHVVPPLIAYLQFATMDRRPPGTAWIVAFVLLATAALLAFTIESKTSIGRMYSRQGQAFQRRSPVVLGVALAVAAVTGVGSAVALAATIPESGLVSWRTQSGIGSGLYGSGSFNLFVGLQQSLVDLSDEPMFYATVSSAAPPNRELYWKLVTLDTFDGENWRPSEQTFAKGGEPRWELRDWQFEGPTTRVAARVRIAGLSGQYLPTLYSPVALESDEELLAESFRVREDGSVAVDLQLLDGWEYQLEADVPTPDWAQLASQDGEFSPIFQEAADSGALQDLVPSSAPTVARPDSLESYTDLPDSVADDVGGLARTVVSGGSTPFERGLLLESFFRSGDFTYSTDVDTGHTSLDLTEWLLDPESRNYRTGYCEQFATAMAVMSRALNIPTRVVLGFTPGSVEQQGDGSEYIVVRERNAHAWVELWMDGQGWVRFDPTPRADGVNPSVTDDEIGFDLRQFIPAPGEGGGSGVAPEFPIPPERLLGEDVPEFGENADGAGATRPNWPLRLLWIPLVGLAVAAIPGVKALRRRRRLDRMGDGEVAAAWAEIVDRLADLGSDVDPAHTPVEIAQGESADLVPLARLYSAAAYGGKTQAPCVAEFTRAEAALKSRYRGRRWNSSYLRLDSFRPGR